MQEVRNILKSTLEKIGDELNWEYQDIISEQSVSIRPQSQEIDTSFIDEYKDVIE